MSATGFAPLPLLANPHVQTVLGLWMKGAKISGPTEQVLVPLPDGDTLVLHDDTPAEWRSGDPVAIVLHGLTGSAQSRGVTHLVRRMLERHIRTVRVDLRGAGAGFALSRSLYHGGCSADVREALRIVAGRVPQSPLWLVGTSLGGNIALKLAGEMADHPVPALAKIAAINPPIDLHACTELLRRRSNRLYEWHFLFELKRNVRKLARVRGEELPHFPRGLTMMAFDELYTAPRHGFAGVDDYYRQSSSIAVIPRIGVPTLVLTARDDPFIAVASFEQLAAPANVDVRIADRGGHTGFLGRDGAGGIGWAETTIVNWLQVG